MNLLDILSTAPLYFCRKGIGATNENSNFDLRGVSQKQNTPKPLAAQAMPIQGR